MLEKFGRSGKTFTPAQAAAYRSLQAEVTKLVYTEVLTELLNHRHLFTNDVGAFQLMHDRIAEHLKTDRT